MRVIISLKCFLNKYKHVYVRCVFMITINIRPLVSQLLIITAFYFYTHTHTFKCYIFANCGIFSDTYFLIIWSTRAIQYYIIIKTLLAQINVLLLVCGTFPSHIISDVDTELVHVQRSHWFWLLFIICVN